MTTNQPTQEELSGGLKNALERGQSLASAKQSFINAGYSKQQVEQAAKQISGVSVQSPPITQTAQSQEQPTTTSQKQSAQSAQQLPKTAKPYPTNKKSHKILYILLGIISILLLIGAGLLGLYWDRLMAMF